MYNKRTITVVLIVGFLIIVGAFIGHYLLSFHAVTFNVSSGVSANLYNKADSNKSLIKKLTAPKTTAELQNGTYCTTATGTVYDQTPSCFTVSGKALMITVNPDYSTDHLADLLVNEISDAHTAISNKYSNIISDYTMEDGQLFGKGQYYATTLTQIVDPSNRGDVYHVVLQKKNGNWEVITTPSIVLTSVAYPSIPASVLRGANALIGSN